MNGADSRELVAARRSYGSMPLIVLTALAGVRRRISRTDR